MMMEDKGASIERTAEQERAAIVGWLRAGWRSGEAEIEILDIADTIERGDHIEYSGYAETSDGR